MCSCYESVIYVVLKGAQEKVKEREELVEKPGGPGQSQIACKVITFF